jgi:hypothetical protein
LLLEISIADPPNLFVALDRIVGLDCYCNRLYFYIKIIDAERVLKLHNNKTG